MKSKEKIGELRNIIGTKLTPLINRDYRYLMMCDHQNIGDTLIMEGEFQFLNKLKKVRCKEFTTMISFQNRCPEIPKDDLLIMRGSGSFGDIWPTAPNFWKFVMEKYPDNPILFMPQTIHFEEERNLSEMSKLISQHKKVILCVRDEDSYNIAKIYFNCETHLIPDMAFFMNNTTLLKNVGNENKTLIVKRTDKEASHSSKIDQIINNTHAQMSDWPTFAKFGRIERIKEYLFKKRLFRVYDIFIRYIYRLYIIHEGKKFLKPYREVYATRMHAGIFAMLMGKKVHFLDNNYGKLSRVFNTWLTNVDNVFLD